MSDYKTAIEAAIEKEKRILEKETAVQIAQDVAELEVDEDGNVQKINDGEKNALNTLVKSYQEVGGAVSASLIAKKLQDEGLDGLDLPDRIEKRLDNH